MLTVTKFNSMIISLTMCVDFLTTGILEILAILIGWTTLFSVTNYFSVTASPIVRISERRSSLIDIHITFLRLTTKLLLSSFVVSGIRSIRRTLDLMLLYWSLSLCINDIASFSCFH